MKAIGLTMVAGSVLAALSMSATADTDLSRIEARLQVLEQRAAQAEARATAAEQKAQRLEQMMMAAPALRLLRPSPLLPLYWQVTINSPRKAWCCMTINLAN